MAMEITQVLLNAQAQDGILRKHAEENLKQFKEQDLPSFLLSLAVEFANEDKPIESRKLAGLLIKNAVDFKDLHERLELLQRWMSLDTNLKYQIENCLLKSLFSPVHDARSAASKIIAKIAGFEFLLNQWSGLVSTLFAKLPTLPAYSKQVTLETFGYICLEVSPIVVDPDDINMILTAIVRYMNSSEGSSNVRLASTQALYNALGFAEESFSDDMQCNRIMCAVCEATQTSELEIRKAAFSCLVAISSTHYDKLAPYIVDIFKIVTRAVMEEEELVVYYAMEVWTSICKEEITILEEQGEDANIRCFYFIKKATPVLVPILLGMFLKENDQDEEEEEWNIALEARKCFKLVAQAAGNSVVPFVMPFIEGNIRKADWRQREAASYAFGSILQGPSPVNLVALVNCYLNYMLSSLMKDAHVRVKESTAWTLGRIFKFLHKSTLVSSVLITHAHCPQIVTVLLESMKDAPYVAKKSCSALYFLAKGYAGAGPSSSPLTPFFKDIFNALLRVTYRLDIGESRLHIAAYETIPEVVRCLTEETPPTVVANLVIQLITRLHHSLEAHNLSSDESNKQYELHELICCCLQPIIEKIGSLDSTKAFLRQQANRMMNLFTKVFACQTGTAHEESMLAIGALVRAIGPDFEKHMPQYYKFLEMGLQNVENYQLCNLVIGVVEDVCRALDSKILPYCNGIITQLLNNLANNHLHPSLKARIFSCFGDIALAIKDNFDRYLPFTLPVLQNAAEQSFHISYEDKDAAMHIDTVRRKILIAYSGIIRAFKGSSNLQSLRFYVPDFLWFVTCLSMENYMVNKVRQPAIVVVRDLVDTFGSSVIPLIQESAQTKCFIDRCLLSNGALIKESAERVKLAISQDM